MAICASGEKLLQEATDILRGQVYAVAKKHTKHWWIENLEG